MQDIRGLNSAVHPSNCSKSFSYFVKYASKFQIFRPVHKDSQYYFEFTFKGKRCQWFIMPQGFCDSLTFSLTSYKETLICSYVLRVGNKVKLDTKAPLIFLAKCPALILLQWVNWMFMSHIRCTKCWHQLAKFIYQMFVLTLQNIKSQ